MRRRPVAVTAIVAASLSLLASEEFGASGLAECASA